MGTGTGGALFGILHEAYGRGGTFADGLEAVPHHKL